MTRRVRLASHSLLLPLAALAALATSRCTSSELPAFARPPSLEDASPKELDGGTADALRDAQ